MSFSWQFHLLKTQEASFRFQRLNIMFCVCLFVFLHLLLFSLFRFEGFVQSNCGCSVEKLTRDWTEHCNAQYVDMCQWTSWKQSCGKSRRWFASSYSQVRKTSSRRYWESGKLLFMFHSTKPFLFFFYFQLKLKCSLILRTTKIKHMDTNWMCNVRCHCHCLLITLITYTWQTHIIPLGSFMRSTFISMKKKI